jgi:hypothetical protein
MEVVVLPPPNSYKKQTRVKCKSTDTVLHLKVMIARAMETSPECLEIRHHDDCPTATLEERKISDGQNVGVRFFEGTERAAKRYRREEADALAASPAFLQYMQQRWDDSLRQRQRDTNVGVDPARHVHVCGMRTRPVVRMDCSACCCC